MSPVTLGAIYDFLELIDNELPEKKSWAPEIIKMWCEKKEQLWQLLQNEKVIDNYYFPLKNQEEPLDGDVSSLLEELKMFVQSTLDQQKNSVPEKYVASLPVTLGLNGIETTAYLIQKVHAGAGVYTETWWVDGRIFQCDSDRRTEFFNSGDAIGSIRNIDGEEVYVYALKKLL